MRDDVDKIKLWYAAAQIMDDKHRLQWYDQVFPFVLDIADKTAELVEKADELTKHIDELSELVAAPPTKGIN